MSDRAVFDAMGCEVVVCGATPGTLRAIRTLFADRERTFSRFRPDSELSRVNASPARVVRVSALFAATLRRALVAARTTHGLVDPTLGAALFAAGYDRDLAVLEAAGAAPGREPARAAVTAPAAAPASRLHELRVAGRFLSRPPGLVLDLNGVVKGLAVDDAVALLDRPGSVSAGGDLATRGPALVGLPSAADAEPVAAPGGGDVVLLERGGIATSGTGRRRWRHDGADRHHLIDPATGAPSAAPWLAVTVVAGSAHHADVAAKAAFLAGDLGPRWLDATGLAGRFVTTGGDIVENAAWRAATTRPAAARHRPDPSSSPEEALPCT